MSQTKKDYVGTEIEIIFMAQDVVRTSYTSDIYDENNGGSWTDENSKFGS